MVKMDLSLKWRKWKLVYRRLLILGNRHEVKRVRPVLLVLLVPEGPVSTKVLLVPEVLLVLPVLPVLPENLLLLAMEQVNLKRLLVFL